MPICRKASGEKGLRHIATAPMDDSSIEVPLKNDEINNDNKSIYTTCTRLLSLAPE